MRRIELIRAFRTVVGTLQQSHLREPLLNVLRARADGQAKYRLLAALREYTLRASQYGAAERRVARELDLRKLDDPAWWNRVMAPAPDADARAPAEVAEMARTLGSAVAYLPKLAALLENEALRRRAAPATPPPADGLSHLEVLVIEGEGNGSTPARLNTALESVTLLYEAVATMQRLPLNTLSVIACDSGVDKSFDFLGRTPAIRAVKDVLLSVWDRVMVAKERQPEERLAPSSSSRSPRWSASWRCASAPSSARRRRSCCAGAW